MPAVISSNRPFSYTMNNSLQPDVKLGAPRKVSKLSISELDQEKPKHKYLITAAKILFATVIIAGFIAATVFTFGAAAVAATATASILYGVGAALGASSVGLMKLAAEKNMFRYTGNDAKDVQSFVSLGLNAVVNQIGQNVSKNFQASSNEKSEEQNDKKAIKRKPTPYIEEVDDNTPIPPYKKKHKPIIEEADDRLDRYHQN
jgi:hypothetical protein